MSSLCFSRVAPRVAAAGPSFIDFVLFFLAFFWHVNLLRLAHPPAKVLRSITSPCPYGKGWEHPVRVGTLYYEWVEEPSDAPIARPWLLEVLRITSSIASFLYNTTYICYAIVAALWSTACDTVVAYDLIDMVPEGIVWLHDYLIHAATHESRELHEPHEPHEPQLLETATTTTPTTTLKHAPTPVVAVVAPPPVSDKRACIDTLICAIPKGRFSEDDGEWLDVGRWEEEKEVKEKEKEEKKVVVSGDGQQSGAATQAPTMDHEEGPSDNKDIFDAPPLPSSPALFSSTIPQAPSHGAPSWASIANPLMPSTVATHGLPPLQQVNVYNAPVPVAQMQQNLSTTLLPPLPAPLSYPALPHAVQTSQNSSYGAGNGGQVGNHLVPLQHISVTPTPLPAYAQAFADSCARQPQPLPTYVQAFADWCARQPQPQLLPAYAVAFAEWCARSTAAAAAETSAAPVFSPSAFSARLAALGAPAFPALAPAPAPVPASAPAPIFSVPPLPSAPPVLSVPAVSAAPIFSFTAAPAPAPSGPAFPPVPNFSATPVLPGPAAPIAPSIPPHDDGLDAFADAFNEEFKKQNPSEFAPQATAAQMAARKISKSKAKATGITNAGVITKPNVDMAGAPSSSVAQQQQQKQQKSLPSAGSAGVRNIPPSSKDVKQQQQQKSSADAGSAGFRNKPPAPQQGGAATPSPRPPPTVNKNRPAPMDVDRRPLPRTPEEEKASLTDYAMLLLGASAFISSSSPSSSAAAATKKPTPSTRPLPPPNFRPAVPVPAAGPAERKRPGGGSRPAPAASAAPPPKLVAQPPYDGRSSYRAADGTCYDIAWDKETGEEHFWAGDGQKVMFDDKRRPVDGATGLPWTG